MAPREEGNSDTKVWNKDLDMAQTLKKKPNMKIMKIEFKPKRVMTLAAPMLPFYPIPAVDFSC